MYDFIHNTPHDFHVQAPEILNIAHNIKYRFGFFLWKIFVSRVEQTDIYIGENYSNEYQITKKMTKDFLHPGTLQEARQRLDSVFIS